MSTAFDVEPDSLHRCDDCGQIMTGDQLGEIIGDLGSRLDPGGTVPSGECQSCGALAYPYDPKQDYYVEHKGMRCPYCDSKNIMGLDVSSNNVEAGEFVQGVECHDCGELWTDVFVLKGFREE